MKSSEVDGSSMMASSGIVGAGAVTLVATEFDTGCAAGMLAALGKEAVTSCGAATLAGLSGRQTCLTYLFIIYLTGTSKTFCRWRLMQSPCCKSGTAFFHLEEW